MMLLHTMERQNERIDAVLARIEERFPLDRALPIQRFARQFYSHVPPEDLQVRDLDDLYGAALSLWHFLQEREIAAPASGRAKLRIFTPRIDEQGWRSGGTVIEIVNDDMPFLVDSVTTALNGLGIAAHLVIHPILQITRDDAGKLTGIAEGAAPGVVMRESAMHIEIGEQTDPQRLDEITNILTGVLADVRAAVADWQAMRAQLQDVRHTLHDAPIDAVDAGEAASFLAWLGDDNFTFLGYREYRFGGLAPGDDAPDAQNRGEAPGLDIVHDRGLGILRDMDYQIFDGLRRFHSLPPEIQAMLLRPEALLITKSNRHSTVHRPARMDAIGVRIFGADGAVVGGHLFVGLFTSAAYGRRPLTIPMIRRKVNRVLERAGFPHQSHDGKALLHILDSLPRDELFQMSDDELYDMAVGILNLQERQRVALFARRDAFGRAVSCFVYVPRERYSSELRQRFARILEAAFNGSVTNYFTQLDESVLARVHFIIEISPGAAVETDIAQVERRLAEAARGWQDRLLAAAIEIDGEAAGLALIRDYADAFPTSYRERFSAASAIYDAARSEEIRAGAAFAVTLYQPSEAENDELRFKIYQAERPAALSDVLPMLENLGFKVISEEPYEIKPAGGAKPIFLQDFRLFSRVGAVDVARGRARFEAAFARLWSDEMENDGFNRLVLGAGLDWRQVTVLRAYAKIIRHAGSAFSQAYMEDTFTRHPVITRGLVRLFERRFAPNSTEEANADQIAAEIERALDTVTNLDEDRILRSFLDLIQKTLRTNYFQRSPIESGRAGGPKPYLAIKLHSGAIDLLPLPRPLYEIYVYSPRMEGVHLRGGKVARGGIRWSDRKEDFRTEILGLMKAQMVKNAVIVPVGSKGGFVVKRPPQAGATRDALMAEVVECYKTLIRGLLDLTDNIVLGKIAPPADVVRHDDDDPYLVVAADKGTATFSDIANEVAAEYGYWLGDAFASGGSAGYDHKALGITARGAWETVKRHFRELGRDIQSADFTVVGVGDMSGDVFGNGMLCSEHIKLIGAFDHRHIFLDPDPDPAASFAERQRLFNLPRSSWADYDPKLISKGGGVYERGLKSVPLSPEMRQRLGIEAPRPTPAEIVQALLRAEVDLLWFGGIGTYVKSSAESQADAGDRTNDALRVNASQLRAHVVGEGANLAVTQRGRIEYALQGGRINTDAIDNSAGVDTSDHEVNLKILLDAVVEAGDLTVKQRNQIIQELSADVAALVLRDNYDQGLALSLAEAQAEARLDAQARFMRGLEKSGKLDRAVEYLPDDESLTRRAAAHKGLTRPELAVLMAYAKTTLAHDLVHTDLPDDSQLKTDLVAYFPRKLMPRFEPAIGSHRLRREIVATVAANELVNRCGITFVADMQERTGRGIGDIARAYAIIRAVYDLESLWAAVNALDNKVAAQVQTDMLQGANGVAERAVAWFLRADFPLDIEARIAEFRPGVAALAEHLATIIPPEQNAELAKRIVVWQERAVPASLAERVAGLDFLASAVDIVRLSPGSSLEIAELGRRFFAVGARFRLDLLRRAARQLRAETPWQRLAVAATVEDFYAHQAALTATATRLAAPDFESWLAAHDTIHLETVIDEILQAPQPDIAMLTVADRLFRRLISA